MEKQSQNKEYVSIYHDVDTGDDFVRVKALGYDFLIPLHDEFGGHYVTYYQAEDLPLPDESKARLIGFFRKEIRELIEQAGGTPMNGLYWTSTPAEELFGAAYVSYQLVFSGAHGNLTDYGRISSGRVRVALDFDAYISNKSKNLKHQK